MTDPTDVIGVDVEKLFREWCECSFEGRPRTVEDLCGNVAELREPLRDRIAEWLLVRCTEQDAPDLDELCKDCPEVRPRIEAGLADVRWLASAGITIDGPSIADDEDGTASEPPGVFESLVALRRRRYLGGGGGGAVYLAHDETIDREVAVKWASGPDRCAMLRREAETMARLHDASVPSVHAFGERENEAFLAMAFEGGQNLATFVAAHGSDRLSARSPILRVFSSACRTVAIAHERGVVHNDLKPLNIHVSRDTAVVLDWGLATDAESGSAPDHPVSRVVRDGEKPDPKSRPKTIQGTIEYTSPEHLRPSPTDFRSDVYCLGATLFHCLTGRPAVATPENGWGYADVVALRDRLAAEGPPTIREEPGRPVPRALVRICQRAMAIDPDQRYQTARELADDVDRFTAGERVRAYADEAVLSRVVRWVSRHARATAISLVLAVVVMIVAGLVAAYTTSVARDEHEARLDLLRFTADVTAWDLEQDLRRRFRALEREADDEFLRMLLRAEGGVPPDVGPPVDPRIHPTQSWLEEVRERHLGAFEADSWFLCHHTGLQLARAPYGDTVRKGNFLTRSYFRGNAESGDGTHLVRSHVSDVYRSRNTGHQKFACSTPVWGEPGEFLGVLGTSVEVGPKLVARLRSTSSQFVMVVNVAEGENRGLVLLHPELRDDDPTLVAEEHIQTLVETDARSGLLPSFRDPVSGATATAAWTRVEFNHAGHVVSPGWVVVVATGD